MARNQEKARSMLFKFREAQLAEMGYAPLSGRKPGQSSSVQTIRECEIYRTSANDEIIRKVAKMSDTSMTEFQVRELNDEINRLIREKSKWEHRIRELGGPDYRSNAPRILDEEGRELPGTRGYKYFGRAKELPGVRELFEEMKPALPPMSRGEMRKAVDADYYGFRDEDDGVLRAVEYEKQVENGGIFHIEYMSMESEGTYEMIVNACDFEPFPCSDIDIAKEGVAKMTLFNTEIPSQKQVEQFLIERRKQKLLEKYVL